MATLRKKCDCKYSHCFSVNQKPCSETQMCANHCENLNHFHCSLFNCDNKTNLCPDSNYSMCVTHCSGKNHGHCIVDSCRETMLNSDVNADELNLYFCVEGSSCVEHCIQENHNHCKYLYCADKLFFKSKCRFHFSQVNVDHH